MTTTTTPSGSSPQPPAPVLRGALVTLRLPRPGDDAALLDVLNDPTVAAWWGTYDLDRVRDEFLGDDEDATVYVVERGGEVAGLVQYGEETDPMYRHASLDVAIAAAHQGQGVGGDAVATLAHHLFADRGHHRVTIDPAAGNARAIRAYRRVGFREVGVMRRYERSPDGIWHDGLLMDLLPEDLPPGTPPGM